jgi:nitrite reductase (cytochrome c-552)
MIRRRKILVTVAIAALIAVIAACSPNPNGDAGTTPGATAQTDSDLVSSWDRYADQYPYEVASFKEGLDEVEWQDGKVHSHSLLYANEPATVDRRSQMGIETDVSCVACKSTTFASLYEKEGLAAFSASYADYANPINHWDCGLCHENAEPGSSLKVGGVTGQILTAGFFNEIDPKNAVCGQCHNIIATYIIGSIKHAAEKQGIDFTQYDPYRYGLDPDAIIKAQLEDGYVLAVDKETGIPTYENNSVVITDIESFQGSVMQSLGVTCVDCHMPVRVAADGTEYRSHNASSTPSENEETLEYCLTCHTAQGVKSTEEMKEFISSVKERVVAKETVLDEKLATLKGLIAEGTKSGAVDKAILDQARQSYMTAAWYESYVESDAEVKGTKVAHNPDAFDDYLDRAIVLVDDAIALF